MSFLADFETSITTAFTTVVNPVSASVASGFAPVFVSGFSIWIMMIAYDVAYGKSEDGMLYLITKIGKIALIGIIALYAWPALQSFADAIRDLFVASVTCTAGPCTGTISDTLEVTLLTPLGQVWAALWQDVLNAFTSGSSVMSSSFWAQLLLTICMLLGYACLTLCVALLAIIGLVMYMVSFASYEMLMAVGPFFLLCLCFPVTQRFFETWVGGVITAILAMALTALLAVLSSTLLGLSALVPTTQTADLSTYDLLFAFFGKCGFALLIAYLYYKTFDLAASLGGGMNLGNNMIGAMRSLSRRTPSPAAPLSTTNQINAGASAAGTARSAARNAVAGVASAAAAGGRFAAPYARAGAAAAGHGAVAVGRYAYNRGMALSRYVLN